MKFGLFQPAHGSAPDIIWQDKDNPLAAILIGALMLEYLAEKTSNNAFEDATHLVDNAINKGFAENALRPIELGGEYGNYFRYPSGNQPDMLIGNRDAFLYNHIVGKTCEGFVIENIHSVLSLLPTTYFHLISSSAEIDYQNSKCGSADSTICIERIWHLGV